MQGYKMSKRIALLKVWPGGGVTCPACLVYLGEAKDKSAVHQDDNAGCIRFLYVSRRESNSTVHPNKSS